MSGLHREKPEKKGVPAYIMTFGDLMTQMLTFFILLNAYSHERNAELMAAGLGSFRRRLESHGLAPITSLPFFSSGVDANPPPAAPPPRDDEGPLQDEPGALGLSERVAEESRAGNTSVLALPGRFQRGSAVVPREAWNALESSLTLFRVSGHELEVEAFAGTDEGSRRARLALSMRRAQALAARIERTGFPNARVVAVGRGAAGSARAGPEARRLLLRIRR